MVTALVTPSSQVHRTLKGTTSLKGTTLSVALALPRPSRPSFSSCSRRWSRAQRPPSSTRQSSMVTALVTPSSQVHRVWVTTLSVALALPRPSRPSFSSCSRRSELVAHIDDQTATSMTRTRTTRTTQHPRPHSRPHSRRRRPPSRCTCSQWMSVRWWRHSRPSVCPPAQRRQSATRAAA
jgi:hypothetical protein